MNNYCCNLLYLSVLSCQIAECIDDKEELTILAADVVVLGDLLTNIATRMTLCQNQEDQDTSETE